VQREVAGNLLVEVGYMANVSHHLTANDFQPQPSAINLMGPGTRRLGALPAVQQRHLDQSVHRQFDLSRWVRSGGKAFQRRVSFLAHYTFSKFLDDVEAANEYGVTGSYMDAYNRQLDKG
jgi:hypothetical protein